MLVTVPGIALGQRPYERPRDPLFPWQWALENRGQADPRDPERTGTPDADVDAVEAFAAGHTGRGIVIALLGQGFVWRDSDLEGSLWRNPGEVPGNGIDDDHNGFVDDVIGYDFGELDPDPTFRGEHDRLVAEIALAPHDDRGIAGIAPAARLMVLKVTRDDGNLVRPALARALRYAVDEGARVLVLPWTVRGGRCDDPELGLLDDAFSRAAERAFIAGGHPADWPACLPSVVSVQATDADDLPTVGPHASLDFAAPGSDGRTPVRVSFALGLVAGSAALLTAQDPDRSPSWIRRRLAETADHPHPERLAWDGARSPVMGGGRINLSRALRTDFDGDGVIDADDPDADGDGVPDADDPLPLDPR